MKFRPLLLVPLMIGCLQAASVDDLTFRLTNGGTAYEVYDCDESATGDLAIPDTYNGLPVTSIYGEGPDYSMATDGRGAFSNCGLDTITLPNSITRIGGNAFSHSSTLSSINIPASVTQMGPSIFRNCSNLNEIQLEEGLIVIGDGFFNPIPGLTIQIPDSLLHIGDQDPDNTGFPLPESITTYDGSNGLRYIFSSSGSTAYLAGGTADEAVSGELIIPELVLGAKVQCIFDGAFSREPWHYMSEITSVTIPSGIKSIPQNAFRNQAYLEEINFAGITDSIGRNAFEGCHSLTNLPPLNGLKKIGERAFRNCDGLSSIELSHSISTIGAHAFENCPLQEVSIPSSVKHIGSNAFGATEYFMEVAITVEREVSGSIKIASLPSKFSGSLGFIGFSPEVEATFIYDDTSEGLLANESFIAGISDAVSIDTSSIDAAIAQEAQARADADAALQQQITDLQAYIDAAVATARSEGVTAGIQAVTSDPQSYQLYSESNILEMNVSNPTLSMLNEFQQAQVEFTLETSTNLEDWTIEERIQRTVQATEDQFFVRISSGVPSVTPTVLVFNHPSYGEILTDQSGNVLYGFSIDSAGGDPLYSGSAWPLASHSADPEPDADVTAALTRGTFSNTSGGPWLKINGRPVYTYVGDSEPNQASGHGLGSVWFTIKADGSLNQ